MLLNGLNSLDEVSGNLKYLNLDLSGLTSINRDVAQELARVTGRLSLNGLTSIDADVAKILGNVSGTLRVYGRSKKDIVKELAKVGADEGDITFLEFDDLVYIDIEVVSERKRTALELNGLTSIDKTVAKELVRGHALLELNGLTSIDKEVAQELAKISGSVHLGGLTAIDKDVAQELAKLRSVYLVGLTSIDKDVAQELAKLRSVYLVGLTSIDKDVAQELAKFEGTNLWLNSEVSIDEDFVEILKSKTNIVFR
jgi:hypothetical protein